MSRATVYRTFPGPRGAARGVVVGHRSSSCSPLPAGPRRGQPGRGDGAGHQVRPAVHRRARGPAAGHADRAGKAAARPHRREHPDPRGDRRVPRFPIWQRGVAAGGGPGRRQPISWPAWCSPIWRHPGRWDLDDPVQVANWSGPAAAGVVAPRRRASLDLGRRTMRQIRRNVPTWPIADGAPVWWGTRAPVRPGHPRRREQPVSPSGADRRRHPGLPGPLRDDQDHGRRHRPRAGVSRATVYRSFRWSGGDLLAAVVDTEMARFFSALGVRLGEATDLAEALVGGIVEARPGSATTPPWPTWSTRAGDSSRPPGLRRVGPPVDHRLAVHGTVPGPLDEAGRGR